ncbi:AMP-dependent synthetase/ligase, AMP-binding enzyme C-terminal domain protein [Artemisia annua]|uniref:AMP-dependent synthetase/ligase, AMP-binding enzyme C-terminal domain protein n=1 Tax=Artemisia annua TaxID=35608 RepID=A0A2U1QFD5_ARTAN|nr:AMP-dependent synthetase/ligase, AMP-binding enzyme C-terminal domain protein [Artemisia annua]
MKSLQWDAKTIGEVMVGGNTVMNGYHKDTKATQEAFESGWFRSGDLVIFRHPALLEAAVVGHPDDHWGETPCAFVKVKEGYKLNGDELIAFCQKNLPHYMAPRTVVFEELPKTSTGKTQKFVLREKAKAMRSISSK